MKTVFKSAVLMGLIVLASVAEAAVYRCPGNVYQSTPCDSAGGAKVVLSDSGAGSKFADVEAYRAKEKARLDAEREESTRIAQAKNAKWAAERLAAKEERLAWEREKREANLKRIEMDLCIIGYNLSGHKDNGRCGNAK